MTKSTILGKSSDHSVIAANLLLLCDPQNGSVVILKVHDVAGQDHRFVMAGFQIHRYLRRSQPRAAELRAGMPQMPFDEADWDTDTAHVLRDARFELWNNGLIIRSTTQREESVTIALTESCEALFRHYAEQCAPYLVDLDAPSDRGNSH